MIVTRREFGFNHGIGNPNCFCASICFSHCFCASSVSSKASHSLVQNRSQSCNPSDFSTNEWYCTCTRPTPTPAPAPAPEPVLCPVLLEPEAEAELEPAPEEAEAERILPARVACGTRRSDAADCAIVSSEPARDASVVDVRMQVVLVVDVDAVVVAVVVAEVVRGGVEEGWFAEFDAQQSVYCERVIDMIIKQIIYTKNIYTCIYNIIQSNLP